MVYIVTCWGDRWFFSSQVMKGTHQIGIYTPVIIHYLSLVEFGGPLQGYDVALLCPKPDPLPAYFNLAKVFSQPVWAGLLLCFGCAAVAYVVLSRLTSRHSTARSGAATDDVFYLWSTHLAQCEQCRAGPDQTCILRTYRTQYTHVRLDV